MLCSHNIFTSFHWLICNGDLDFIAVHYVCRCAIHVSKRLPTLLATYNKKLLDVNVRHTNHQHGGVWLLWGICSKVQSTMMFFKFIAFQCQKTQVLQIAQVLLWTRWSKQGRYVIPATSLWRDRLKINVRICGIVLIHRLLWDEEVGLMWQNCLVVNSLPVLCCCEPKLLVRSICLWSWERRRHDVVCLDPVTLTANEC